MILLIFALILNIVKKHKEKDLKRGKSRESVDSRDSSHSRERSTEQSEDQRSSAEQEAGLGPPCLLPSRPNPTKQRSTRRKQRRGRRAPQVFDKSRLGTKDFVGPNERGGRVQGTFLFRARERGWGRGNYSGNNNNSNNDFQKRSREEEWDPEYTPKNKKYYFDSEDEGSDKWLRQGHGLGAFPRGGAGSCSRSPVPTPSGPMTSSVGKRERLKTMRVGQRTEKRRTVYSPQLSRDHS